MAFLKSYSFLLTGWLALGMSACTSSSSPSSSSSPPPLGKPLFQFDIASISRLMIVKNDPNSGDQWSVGLENHQKQWFIERAPEGMTPTDRLANTGIINHLLDTLKSLRPSKHLYRESAQHASQWGLDPPVFWIKLEGQPSPIEIRIGAKANLFSNYAETGGHFLEVDGAALKMLEYLSDFNKLRHHKLMTWKLDDADRVEMRWLTPQGLTRIRAERHTGDWVRTDTQAQGRKLSLDAHRSLEALPQLEIEKFDLTASLGKPWLTIEWKSRREKSLTLEIDSNLKARASDRPGAVFQLYPEARKLLEMKNFTH